MIPATTANKAPYTFGCTVPSLLADAAMTAYPSSAPNGSATAASRLHMNAGQRLPVA